MGIAVKCQQCRQPLQEWEAGLCEECGMANIEKSMTLRDAYDCALLHDIVRSNVVYEYVIECQWESQDKQKGCVDIFVKKSCRPLSNFEVYDEASKAGYRYESGRVICGCHGDDDD